MFSSGFFNSLNGDRKYDSEQVSSLFDGLISDGVFANVGEQFAVVPSSGMNVIVKTGRAWFNHTWSLNDTWMTLTVDAPDPLRSRIDSVVLEVNHDPMVRENSIKIVKGAPASSPLPPTMLHTDIVNQYRLANITVDKDTTTITTAHVQSTVGMMETPFVTAPIQSVDVSVLFQQWDGQFQEWFDNVKDQLSGDVAANLQKQVDERVRIVDKANAADIQVGTPGKWVDAALAKDALMNLISNMSIGDILYSSRDLESESDGKMIACDQRLISDSDYPELCEIESIKYRYLLDYFKNNYAAVNISDANRISNSGNNKYINTIPLKGSSINVNNPSASIRYISGPMVHKGYVYFVSQAAGYGDTYVERVKVSNLINGENIIQPELIDTNYITNATNNANVISILFIRNSLLIFYSGSSTYRQIDLDTMTKANRIGFTSFDIAQPMQLPTQAYVSFHVSSNRRESLVLERSELLYDLSSINNKTMTLVGYSKAASDAEYDKYYFSYNYFNSQNSISIVSSNLPNLGDPSAVPSAFDNLYAGFLITMNNRTSSSQYWSHGIRSAHLVWVDLNNPDTANFIDLNLSNVGLSLLSTTSQNWPYIYTIVNKQYIYVVIANTYGQETLIMIFNKSTKNFIRYYHYSQTNNGYNPISSPLFYLDKERTSMTAAGTLGIVKISLSDTITIQPISSSIEQPLPNLSVSLPASSTEAFSSVPCNIWGDAEFLRYYNHRGTMMDNYYEEFFSRHNDRNSTTSYYDYGYVFPAFESFNKFFTYPLYRIGTNITQIYFDAFKDDDYIVVIITGRPYNITSLGTCLCIAVADTRQHLCPYIPGAYIKAKN